MRYYEEELGLFGQFAREFRARYPKPAGELHLSGDSYDDPSVARLIQSVALMSARIKKRLDDDYPKFTESLLESLYPHYLRPLPSHTVVQVGYRDQAEIPETPSMLARGTMLRTSAERDNICLFRTVYDVVLAPLKVSRVAWAPLLAPPRALRLPRGAGSGIAITIEQAGGAHAGLPALLPPTLRLFADGEASLRAAFVDALFLRCAGAWVQPEGDGAWLPLARIPLRLAGFAEDDAMIPFPARSHPALRLLTEYFCYPEKFNFIDLELDELRALLPPRCARFTLHLALSGIGADSDTAHLLSGLDAHNLLPGCTPVINLFPKAGAPLQLSYTSADYPLLADSAHAGAYEIHSVDAVRLVREGGHRAGVTRFAPLYTLDCGLDGAAEEPEQDRTRERPGAGGRMHYWITRRDHATAAVSPGHEMRIALIDGDFRSTETTGATLSSDLTCTNRDHPSHLRYGSAHGDLRTDELAGIAPIRMLRKPSPSWRFDSAKGAHWRLISHLSLNPGGAIMAGLADFQKMLSLYDLARSPDVQRRIGGIVGLEHGAVRAWVRSAPVSTLMPGIGIRLTVDEDAFAGAGLYVFAQVLDHYFALNAQINCFTRLQVVSSRSGREILACAPRTSVREWL
ncbi:type VI secretion system baseplate subunit TssF [Massilia forsythiae]|uniref:Type VI secretion system baseplate subunit TssF n=1 Tax=Massilia forsythiae TaxID=2728020 RepID=A0A7Z2ZVJ7_9BURK|nr:type VI secretion system baseplate subunit TssF [Massilia forsythiae]